MARPSKEKNRKYQNIISIKLTDAELELLTVSAERANVSRSEYLRNLLLNKKMTAKYEVVVELQSIKELTAEYGKIGSNLNQIAKYFNTGGEYSLAIQDDLYQCIYELSKLRKEVLKLTGEFHGYY